ncbi:hypothetical protein [Nannocystis sp.]|uniref:hypothetical protein n=1 Tax=Nannocystis sp. TaxID=1962667 RepID=UPI0026007E85|nr:hypothetical protein [Nannocystis sp.]MBK7830216.1 hypothetical protein [Nannocystis sp.]
MSKPSPLQNVKKLFGSKEQLIAKVIDLLTPGDGESREAFSKRLKYVANAKLLRLAQVGEKIKSLGGREALVAKLAELKGEAKDKDFVASLNKLSLPRLLDSVQSLSKKVKPAGKPAGKPAAKPAGKPAAKA